MVLLNTTMIKDVIEAFNLRKNDDLSITFPDVLDQIMGKDASFELSISGSIQPLKLQYQPNNIVKSVAYVFINTEFNGLEWPNAEEHGQKAHDIFKDELNFKQITIIRNGEKEQIKEILHKLADQARAFEIALKTEADKSETGHL